AAGPLGSPVALRCWGAPHTPQTTTVLRFSLVVAAIVLSLAPCKPPTPPPAAAAPPPPPPAAPPPAPPKQFVVYFEFDKSNLTPEGARVVQDAAAAYKATGSARVAGCGGTAARAAPRGRRRAAPRPRRAAPGGAAGGAAPGPGT